MASSAVFQSNKDDEYVIMKGIVQIFGTSFMTEKSPASSRSRTHDY